MPSTRRPTHSRAKRRTAPEAMPALKLVESNPVESVRRRIQNGYYDRDEVRNRLAQAVLLELRKS